MGQVLHTIMKAASADRAILFEYDGSSRGSIIGSGREYRETLEDMAREAFKGKEYSIESYSSGDYEEKYSCWECSDGNGGKRLIHEWESSEDDVKAPDWFIPFDVQGEWMYVLIYYYNECNSVRFIGFSEEEAFELVHRHFSSHYIRIGDRVLPCGADGDIVHIDTLPEDTLLKVFGRQPKFINATGSLFWKENGKDMCHPELIAVYGSVNGAMTGYSKGEFSLWDTSEGLNFYGRWRNCDFNDSQAARFRAFKSLVDTGYLDAIEGKGHKESPLYKEAEGKFLANTVKYYAESTGTYQYPMNRNVDGRLYGYFEREGGGIVRKPFRMEEYWPLD